MFTDNIIVHTLWVRGKLSLLEQLTIKILQKHGHTVLLWTYDPNIGNVPGGTIVRDASEILPESSIFTFQGVPVPSLPNAGLGSLSHWSDQFQVKLLNMEGGIYSQLDVTYLEPLDIDTEYKFHETWPNEALGTYFMKCPKGSSFTIEAYAALKNKINADTIKNLDWGCSMRVLMDVIKYNTNLLESKERYFFPCNCLDLGGEPRGPFTEDPVIEPYIKMIHWSNASLSAHKNNPIPGSTYYKLLQSVNLI